MIDDYILFLLYAMLPDAFRKVHTYRQALNLSNVSGALLDFCFDQQGGN